MANGKTKPAVSGIKRDITLNDYDRKVLWLDFKGKADAIVKEIGLKTLARRHGIEIGECAHIFKTGTGDEIEFAREEYIKKLEGIRNSSDKRKEVIRSTVAEAGGKIDKALNTIKDSDVLLSLAIEDAEKELSESDLIAIKAIENRINRLMGLFKTSIEHIHTMKEFKSSIDSIIKQDWDTMSKKANELNK